MNFYSFQESMNGNLVVVDVQPAYKNYIHFKMGRFIDFISKYNKILVLFNGPEMGMDSQEEIIQFYMDYGLQEEVIYKLTFFEKGYAFFRDLMDACWAREDIIKIIKYMLKKNYYDIRQLTEQDIKKLRISDLTMDVLESHGFYIPELKGILPSWNRSDLCGGGFNECLNEVILLSEAMNIKMNLINEFVYGQ